MSSARSLGRDIAVVIFGISSVLCFASGRASKPAQDSIGRAGSEAAEIAVGRSQTVLPNGSELLTGGIDGASPTKLAFVVDPQTGSRSEVSDQLSLARAFHSATLLPNGNVLILGGGRIVNSILGQAELFDPGTRRFKQMATVGLTGRAHHSATLLTDGRVLIAGGLDGQGNTLSRIDLWDFRSGQVSKLSVTLNTPRSGQTATLLPDGTVLLWGGLDANGSPLDDGEIIDPSGPTVRLVGRASGDLSSAASPYLDASIPQNGETNIAPDQFIALRFSKPLASISVNSSTVSLRSSTGNVTINVVPAEGGTLAFITPENTLDTDTTYTLSVSGAKDSVGQALPDTTIQFTTAATVESGSLTPGPSSSDGGTVSSTSENALSADISAPPSDLRQLPILHAPVGVTALAGQVLTLDRSPLPNVRIELDSKSAMTDNTGRFVVQDVGSGHHVMIVDGTTANTRSASYGLYRVGVDLKAGRTNSLNYTIWMTALDTAHEVSLPSPTTSDMVVTNPNVPGLELHIPAGTVILDARGSVVTHIGITGIPVSQPPFPLKAGINYPVYFTIQPGGATIETSRSTESLSSIHRRPGVTIHYRNYLSARPGSRFPFWAYDPEQKGWYIYGHGRVGIDANDIAPEEGTQLSNLDGAMVSIPSNGDSNGPKDCLGADPCNPQTDEPVDLQTGLYVYNKTDLVLNDVIPIALSRSYRPGDFNLRAFGIGTSMSFDNFMTGDDNQTPEGYTYQDLNLQDGGKIHFTRTSPCLNANGYCDFSNALYEATSAPGDFYGAILQFVPTGGDELGITTSDYWQITTKNGTVYQFPDSDGLSNPRAAALQAMHDRYGNSLRFARDGLFNLTQ